MGERRLLSLINATVSHEMRNPINSIHTQVMEMKFINQQLEVLTQELPQEQVQLKKQLEKLLHRYVESVKIQMSGEKILSFLVNDILDYAQISAGKFRKFAL